MAYDYSRADWNGFRDHLRDVPWEDIFNLSASTAACEFCEWLQVRIDVCIPHHKYQANPHSWPYFIEITFFCLYQQNKSSESKVKFRKASNRCKRALKLPNLHMLLKRVHHFPECWPSVLLANC